jgi:hypothetical protein
MGPPGFRDKNLKLFVNRMRRAGYDLYHNPPAPGWKWTWNSSAKAYNLEDHKDLGDYVEELPKSFCDKNGDQQNPCPLTGPKPNGPIDQPTLPVVQNGRSPQVLQLASYDGTQTKWQLVDVLGRVHATGDIDFDGTITIEDEGLMAGMYFVVVEGMGMVGRYVKQN